MAVFPRWFRWLERLALDHLTPPERLSEMMFGVFILVSITGSVELALEEDVTARAVITAGLGAAIAWGVVDTVVHLLNRHMEVSRKAELQTFLRYTKSRGRALETIENSLEGTAIGLLDSRTRERLLEYLWKAQQQRPGPEPRMRATDYLGALGAGLLVPAVAALMLLPLVLVNEVERAIRISHGVGILLLFLIGAEWGAYAGRSRFLTGFALVLLGGAISGIILLLGG